MSSKKNNPGGPGTSSSWNTSPFAFAPNTNTLDKASMPSAEAEAARQKSAQVMAAIERGNTAEADRLMAEGKPHSTQGQLVPPGPLRWIKRKLSGKGKDGENVRSEGVERERVVVGDKGKE